MKPSWMQMLMKRFQLPKLERWQSRYPKERLLMLKVVSEADISDTAVEKELVELSKHWDGYVREAAVRKLATGESIEALEAIIERLNDWVPQVRMAAAEAGIAYAEIERINRVLNCLAEILALGRKSRADHAVFMNKIGKLLALPEVREKVLKFFCTSRGEVARYLLTQMLNWQDSDSLETLRVAACHPDYTVRACVINRCGQAELLGGAEILCGLLMDVHPRNRKAALLNLWEKTHEEERRRSLINRCLIDEAAPVRELAIAYAKQSGFDVETYVQHLIQNFPTGTRSDIGLLGLVGMLANKQYLSLLRIAYTDQRPATRRAALAAWVNVSRETADITVAQALTDVSSKIFTLAAKLVQKGKAPLSLDQLADVSNIALHLRDPKRVIGIAKIMPVWDRFEILLRALQRAQTQEDKQLIKIALQCWEKDQRNSFSNLTESHKSRLLALVKQSGYANDMNLEMQFALMQFGLLEH